MSSQGDELIRLYRTQQVDFHESNCLMRSFIGGRGSGKTVVGAVDLVLRANKEKANYGIFAPTYGDLHDFTLRTLMDTCRPFILRANMSSHPLVTLHNGSQILCRSLDDPEAGRGPSYRGVWIDEGGKIADTAVQTVLGSLRYAGKMGWLSVTTTPKGKKHWTYTMWYDEQGNLKPNRFMVQACSDDNPFLPTEYDVTLRGIYTKAFARQELDGQFVDLSGGLFHREWFKPIAQVPVQFDRVCRFWDMAATPVTEASPDPDWTAGVKVGYKAGQWYIIDAQHDRLTPMGNRDLVWRTMVLDGAGVISAMEEEGGSSGKSLVDVYRREVFIGHNFKSIKPTTSKWLRAQPLAAAAEAGNVFILSAPWNEAFLDEMASFSEKCAHDDLVDASAGAMNVIRESLGGKMLFVPGAQTALDSERRKLDDTIRQQYEGISDPKEKLAAAETLHRAGFSV